MYMDKFIYVFNDDIYKRMLAEGFTLICECNLGKKAYVFENSKRVFNFSEKDKKQLLFTNKAYF